MARSASGSPVLERKAPMPTDKKVQKAEWKLSGLCPDCGGNNKYKWRGTDNDTFLFTVVACPACNYIFETIREYE